MGLGIQIDVFAGRMTDAQLCAFCLAGAAATLISGYALAALSPAVCRTGGRRLRAVAYYCTLALLLADPLYLSALCGLFGEGDMNGIARLVPRAWARLGFGAVLLANAGLFFGRIAPGYRASFRGGGR